MDAVTGYQVDGSGAVRIRPALRAMAYRPDILAVIAVAVWRVFTTAASQAFRGRHHADKAALLTAVAFRKVTSLAARAFLAHPVVTRMLRQR